MWWSLLSINPWAKHKFYCMWSYLGLPDLEFCRFVVKLFAVPKLAFDSWYEAKYACTVMQEFFLQLRSSKTFYHFIEGLNLAPHFIDSCLIFLRFCWHTPCRSNALPNWTDMTCRREQTRGAIFQSFVFCNTLINRLYCPTPQLSNTWKGISLRQEATSRLNMVCICLWWEIQLSTMESRRVGLNVSGSCGMAANKFVLIQIGWYKLKIERLLGCMETPRRNLRIALMSDVITASTTKRMLKSFTRANRFKLGLQVLFSHHQTFNQLCDNPECYEILCPNTLQHK